MTIGVTHRESPARVFQNCRRLPRRAELGIWRKNIRFVPSSSRSVRIGLKSPQTGQYFSSNFSGSKSEFRSSVARHDLGSIIYVILAVRNSKKRSDSALADGGDDHEGRGGGRDQRRPRGDWSLTFARSSIRFLINQPLGRRRFDDRTGRRELKSAGRRVILLGAGAIATRAAARHPSSLFLGATHGLAPFL